MQPLQLNFGKHAGSYVEKLMITQPKYISWILDAEAPSEDLKEVKKHAIGLIEIFDRKPLVRRCSSCDGPSTKLTGYTGALTIQTWCDRCDLYRNDHRNLKLIEIDGYHDTLYAASQASRNGKDWSAMARRLGKLKGLPTYVTDSALFMFFNIGNGGIST